MVRNYVTKRKLKYSKEELEQAITSVTMNELSLSQASRMFNIPTSTIHVSVMKKAGAFWQWPTPPDEIFYEKENIVKRIEAPIPCGSRGQFSFTSM